MLLNLASSNSRITIHYSSENSVIIDDNIDLIETNQHEYVLNFSGNLVNIIENEQLFNFSENDEELGNDNYGVFRGTGVLEKNKGSWYIKQYNLLLSINFWLLLNL